MKVDLDVLNHFKARSQPPHAAPYQTQINSELRAIMERDLETSISDFGKVGEQLLESEVFLNKLLEKLKERKTQPV